MVYFVEIVQFFCELRSFSWIVQLDAIWGPLCEIAPLRNIRGPVKLCPQKYIVDLQINIKSHYLSSDLTLLPSMAT